MFPNKAVKDIYIYREKVSLIDNHIKRTMKVKYKMGEIIMF